MTEFLYDTSSHQLYIGAAAYSQAVENGLVDPRDTEDLVAVLRNDQKEPLNERVTKLDVSSWELEDFRVPGRWILEIANTTDAPVPKPVTQNQLYLLYNRGLGATPEKTKRRFGNTIASYNNELGPVSGRQRGRFDTWSFRQLVAHAREIKQKKGDWPTERDYQNAFALGEGPSLSWIERKTRKVKILEHLGFWDNRDKTKDDFIEWGIQVRSANPARYLSGPLIRCLSARRVGPSLMPIRTNFNSLSSYIMEVDEQFELEQSVINERDQQLLQEAVGALSVRYTPDALDAFLAIDDPVCALAAASRLLLMLRLVPHSSEHDAVRALSFVNNDNFINYAMGATGQTLAQLETLAVRMGIDTILWPVCVDHLHISDEELQPFQGRKKAQKLT